MTRSRRHPAQGSRIVAAGLSAATMLSIVAVLGAAPEGATRQTGASAPPPPAVVTTPHEPAAGAAPATTRGATGRDRAGAATPGRARRSPPSAARAPHTTTGPS